jgi:peptidoglycan hydrolase-like amidase
MKKFQVQIGCLIGAMAVFTASFVYSATGFKTADSIAVNTVAIGTSDSASAQTQTDLQQVYVDFPSPLVYQVAAGVSLSSDSASEESNVSPVTLPQQQSSQAAAIQQDSQGVENAYTSIGGGAVIDQDKQQQDISSSQSNTGSSSSAGNSSVESGSTSQDTSSQPARNPLEEKIDMPSYTPSGKMLTVVVGGKQYTADAVVVVSAITQCEMVGPDSSVPSYYTEAIKAQAVAAHSYVQKHNNNNRAPTVIVRRPCAQVVDLVEGVIDKLVYYNGSVAETLYHASSGLHTQSASYVWGGSYPYLVGVVSKYDEAVKTNAATVDPSQYKIISYTDGGFVNKIEVNGVVTTGEKVKSNLGLRSSKFTIDPQTGSITTYGWGHGVGMSQLGAKGYARYEGWSYTQILTHYYQGTTVK